MQAASSYVGSWHTEPMGTVAISLPPTVLLRLSHEDVNGQQASPGRQRQVAPGARVVMSPAAAKGVAARAAAVAKVADFIFGIKRMCEPYGRGREREKCLATETTAPHSSTAQEAMVWMSLYRGTTARTRGPRWRRRGFGRPDLAVSRGWGAKASLISLLVTSPPVWFRSVAVL